MHSRYDFLVVALLLVGCAKVATTPTKKDDTIAGPLGSKPIQLSIGSNGITRKEGGYICDLDASLGNAHYSEWGETENDARTIVTQKCSKKSGLLLCKKDKAKCREDK